MEQTLVLIKPDGVFRGLIGRITQRFEDAGLKVVGIKMMWPDREHYFHHYETIGKMVSRRGQDVFELSLNMMAKTPVVAIVLEGVGAVSLVRKMTGTTEPREALPGTIRGDFAHVSLAHANSRKQGVPNLIHASGDPDEAAREIKHWFKEGELFSYRVAHEEFTQPQGGENE